MIQKIWAAVNKDGYVALFTGQPVRDEDSGKWVGEYPYINSLVYSQFKNIIRQSMMDWNSSPEMFEFEIK